nr:unnamed protein product [Digitaria exilis]
MNLPSKVKRHWPGKAPEWPHDAAAADDDVSFETALGRVFLEQQQKITVKQRCAPLREETETHAVKLRGDYYYRRVVWQEEILPTSDHLDDSERPPQLDDSEDDAREMEALEARRKRIRERQLPFLDHEDLPLLLREDDIDDVLEMEMDMESESEAESESDDEQTTAVALPTPVSFIPKSQRDTIAERQISLEEDQQRLEELEKKRLEHRNDETRRIVSELIRREELHHQEPDHTALNEAGCDGVVDDELNEPVELEAWRRRELARIKRGREEKTNDMRYYHKGCFFQDNPDDARQTTRTCGIFGRVFSAPTGEDNMMNKAALPEVMRVYTD